MTRPTAQQLRPMLPPLTAQFVETITADAMRTLLGVIAELGTKLDAESQRAQAAEATLRAMLVQQANRYEADDRLTLTPTKVAMYLQRLDREGALMLPPKIESAT